MHKWEPIQAVAAHMMGRSADGDSHRPVTMAMIVEESQRTLAVETVQYYMAVKELRIPAAAVVLAVTVAAAEERKEELRTDRPLAAGEQHIWVEEAIQAHRLWMVVSPGHNNSSHRRNKRRVVENSSLAAVRMEKRHPLPGN